jgi:DNA-binding phage protein
MPPTRTTRASAPSSAIAAQLREIIAVRRLTAYSLARSAGVAPSVVSRFLSRERGLTLESFDAIAGALGLRLIETARGRGRPTRPAAPTDAPGPGPLGRNPGEPGTDREPPVGEPGEFPDVSRGSSRPFD